MSVSSLQVRAAQAFIRSQVSSGTVQAEVYAGKTTSIPSLHDQVACILSMGLPKPVGKYIVGIKPFLTEGNVTSCSSCSAVVSLFQTHIVSASQNIAGTEYIAGINKTSRHTLTTNLCVIAGDVREIVCDLCAREHCEKLLEDIKKAGETAYPLINVMVGVEDDEDADDRAELGIHVDGSWMDNEDMQLDDDSNWDVPLQHKQLMAAGLV